jgi:hypothetical protein
MCSKLRVSMNDAERRSAGAWRWLIAAGKVSPPEFRHALEQVPPLARDAWVDTVFGLDSFSEDGTELPRGCVPYLPCSVDSLLRAIDHAAVHAGDVVVDIGSGLGRAGALVHLLTGAPVVGIEIQARLARAARSMIERLNVTRFSLIEEDAVRVVERIPLGTVFFLYCPFGRDRFEVVLEGIEQVARQREIRLCTVDLPVPPRRWLTPVATSRDVAVYRSTL